MTNIRDLHQGWMKDPSYRREYDAPEGGKTSNALTLNDDFSRVAGERWTKILATGKTVAWDDARMWLEAKTRGESSRKPASRKPDR